MIEPPAVHTVNVGGRERPCVNAQDVHRYLGYRNNFKAWVTMITNRLVEEKDYRRVLIVSSKGKPSTIYELTLDACRSILANSRVAKARELEVILFNDFNVVSVDPSDGIATTNAKVVAKHYEIAEDAVNARIRGLKRPASFIDQNFAWLDDTFVMTKDGYVALGFSWDDPPGMDARFIAAFNRAENRTNNPPTVERTHPKEKEEMSKAKESNSTAMTPFSFEGNPVRALQIEGIPMFHAADVAKAMGYAKPADAYQTHCKSLKMLDYHDLQKLNFLNPHPRGEYFMPEADVVRLAMKSTLPAAERFQDWVCEEVIPTIMKTGGYVAPHAAPPQSTAHIDDLNRVRAALEVAKVYAPESVPALVRELFDRTMDESFGNDPTPNQSSSTKFYTATDLAKEFNAEPQRIGHISHTRGLRTDQYGKVHYYRNRTTGEMETVFLYNEAGRAAIKRNLMS